MPSAKISLVDSIQLATGLALVVGLILVFIELKQAKELSLAELTSQGYAEVMADARTVMGESLAPIIAKSCLSPSELQPAEIVVLHAYYENKVTQITRLRMLELVADFGVPWQDIAAQQIVSVINTQPGQRWFDRNVRDLDAELSTIGAKVKEVIADCTQALTDGGP